MSKIPNPSMIRPMQVPYRLLCKGKIKIAHWAFDILGEYVKRGQLVLLWVY